MGLILEDRQVTIPDVDSLLRTVVIPVEQLFHQIVNGNTDFQQISIRYHRVSTLVHKDEPAQAYFKRIAQRQNHSVIAEIGDDNSIELQIDSLLEWGDDVVQFFHQIVH